ncbi:MAG: hypothetical protein DRI65_06090 [Chloroflexota bacterium]|nr:MAG: hypothetical protein DRI65_06090 [Chloroflexota bacterium]
MKRFVVIHTHRFGTSHYHIHAYDEPSVEEVAAVLNKNDPDTVELDRTDEMIEIFPADGNSLFIPTQ